MGQMLSNVSHKVSLAEATEQQVSVLMADGLAKPIHRDALTKTGMLRAANFVHSAA